MKWRGKSFFGSVLPVVAAMAILCTHVRAADVPSGPAILQQLRSFREMGSVLMVAAHPDDENTQLLAYLERGRNLRTAYLSITRGDGGQNLLGPEFGPELGVIRTQELLAARRLDGPQQFFTRAIDFGYSKDFQSTLDKWDHQEVLSDVVRIVRTFRPDVIITRFSPEPGNTHGHHTASAVLALEAFKLAADPKAFPDQLAALSLWQAKRILMNRGGFGGTTGNGATLQIDIGGTDPATGNSFGSIAGHSRSMHKTQGFGNIGVGSGVWRAGPHPESFQLLDGDPATKDLMDGVDDTWTRIQGGADIATLSDDLIAHFNPVDPAAIVPALLTLRTKLAALPADSLLNEKRHQLDTILQSCLGLTIQTTIPNAEVVPGEPLHLHATATIASTIPVKWLGTRYPTLQQETDAAIDLHPNDPATRDLTPTLPATTPISQPYWLREDPTPGMFRVADPVLIGHPENPPVFPIEQIFEIAGQHLVLPDQPVQLTPGKDTFESRRRLEAVPPVVLKFPFDVQLFTPGSTRTVEVELTASRNDTTGTLRLDPASDKDGRGADWKIDPPSQPFHLAAIGDHAKLTFTLTAPPQPTTTEIAAIAKIGDQEFSNERIDIHYSHIPEILLQPAAKFKAVDLQLAIRGKTIGYLPGAGDSTADALVQMGYTVTPITGDDLTPDSLAKYDAIVIGVRAFNTRTDLTPDRLHALFDYVHNGGTVIDQYNTPNGLKTQQLAPFLLKLSGNLPANRVTNENAPFTLLVPDHPAFTTPNLLTPADFTGWVQERGLNFPSEWGPEFTALLACSDNGEPPLKSGLLIAHDGKGYYVYTGLSLFRQLPAGVPGAYRLMANLVSLGK
jgi:LmbE family N-acetylglucosaminyl deacetylase